MQKVDTHFHIWDLTANYYPWLTDEIRPRVIGEYAAIRKNYLIEDFLADIAGCEVTKAIHVQAEHDYSDPVRETRWLQGIADDPASKGFPHGIVAYADLGAANAQAILEAHCAFPRVRGIRQSLMQHEVDPTAKDPRSDGVWLRNFGLLKRFNLSFDLQLFPSDMGFGARLAAEHPDVQFIVVHTGLPVDPDPEYRNAWRTGLRLLAERPNVAMKMSGFGFFKRDWTTDFMREIIETCADIFGADRCVFGSNYPVDSLSAPCRAFWDAFEAITSSYSPSEQAKLLHANAERIYRV